MIKIKDWIKTNKLTLNVQKTVCMTSGNHTDTIPSNLRNDGDTINREYETR